MIVSHRHRHPRYEPNLTAHLRRPHSEPNQPTHLSHAELAVLPEPTAVHLGPRRCVLDKVAGTRAGRHRHEPAR